jgi:hypothetical protein
MRKTLADGEAENVDSRSLDRWSTGQNGSKYWLNIPLNDSQTDPAPTSATNDF